MQPKVLILSQLDLKWFTMPWHTNLICLCCSLTACFQSFPSSSLRLEPSDSRSDCSEPRPLLSSSESDSASETGTNSFSSFFFFESSRRETTWNQPFFEKMTIFEALKWNYRDQKCSINKSFLMPIHTYPLSKWAISFRECIPLSVNLHLNSKLTNKRLGSKIISRSSCYLSTELFSRRRYLPNCKQIWLLTFTHCLYCFVSS